jgi:hypothetical protein
VVGDIVEVSVLQAQLVKLSSQRLNLFVCQLIIDGRGSS